MINKHQIKKIVKYVDAKEKLVSYSELIEEDVYDGRIQELVQYASDPNTEINCLLTQDGYVFYAKFIVDVLLEIFKADKYALSIKHKVKIEPLEKDDTSDYKLDDCDEPEYLKYLKPYYEQYFRDLENLR